MQLNADANVNRDGYIPNPQCKEFEKYEWIGKLMGACFRDKENLVCIFKMNGRKKVTFQIRKCWDGLKHESDKTLDDLILIPITVLRNYCGYQ